jgi:YegS/Rv2252/BmrU family lipid kinase
MRAAVIINPAAGPRGRLTPEDRVRLAIATLASRGVDGDVGLTRGPGHGCELARAALASGAGLVVAWGGDGTVNEIGRTLAFSSAALGIVPVGSGNGLARALGIPREPRAALLHALDGQVRPIDAGEIDGHVFLNVAGVGLDAHVAHAFAREAGPRGLRRYVAIGARGLLTYHPAACRVRAGGAERSCQPLLLAIANGPQWGNGARIAPDALLDDGLLDLVVVESPSRVRAMLQVPRLFTGGIARAAGVSTTRVASVRITAHAPIPFHADGEPMISDAGSIDVRVLPAALRVRA